MKRVIFDTNIKVKIRMMLWLLKYLNISVKMLENG